MFGELIYYNKKKIEQYMALIEGKATKFKQENTFESNNRQLDYLLECGRFELLLKGRDDYYDFVDDNFGINIKDVKIGSIIRVRGEIFVPEEFDMVPIIDKYKPLLLSSVECKDAEERQLLNLVFHGSKMKVPIFCELGSDCDYWLGIGKVSPDDLLVDYNDLEDYEGKEVTIIAKLEARKFCKDIPLKVFDIYKDFLGLNRAFRKEMKTGSGQEFESIEVKEDYLALELLAIY